MNRGLYEEVIRFRQLTQAEFATAALAAEAYKVLETLLDAQASRSYAMQNPYTFKHIGKVFYVEERSQPEYFGLLSNALYLESERLKAPEQIGGERRNVWLSWLAEPFPKIYLWRE